MAITFGPKRGLVIDGVLLDTWDVPLRALLRAIDQGLVLSSVISQTLTAPPGSPANGDAYIVGASATGAWATHDLSVAVWTTDNPVAPSGEWEFYVPAAGWIAWSVADAGFYAFAAGAWAAFGGGGGGVVTSVAGRTGAVVLAEADITSLVADLGTLAAAIAAAMVNPMTTLGDVISGGASGVPARVAIGTTGQVFTVVSGAPGWATPSASGPSVNDQTASYTAVLGDGNNVVTMSNASANNFTVPPNSAVAFPIGTTLTVIQKGAGQTTLVAGVGVTINNPSSLTTRTQWSTISVTKILTDTWNAAGDLT